MGTIHKPIDLLLKRPAPIPPKIPPFHFSNAFCF